MEFTLRNILAYIVAFLLILSGRVKQAKKKALKGEFILSVYFHEPSKSLFESCVKWFSQQGFHFISLSDLEMIHKGEKFFPKGAVLLTVDDGWITNEENIVAVVDKYNIPVTIFISTDPIKTGNFWWTSADIAFKNKLHPYSKEHLKTLPNAERVKILKPIQQLIPREREAMTIGQLIKIATSTNVTIGGHTVTHPILKNCSDDESYNEISTSKLDLENWLQREVNTFSYPNGGYSEREVNYLQELNFELGFSTAEYYLTQDKLRSHYQLPRFYINEGASLAENICRMTGVWPSKNASN